MVLNSRRNQVALAFASAADSNSTRSKNSSRNRLLNDSMKPFSQGLPGATAIGLVPLPGNQSTNAWQINSEPLSLRMRVGAPRRPMTRASTRRTSAPVSERATCNAKHSRVYSSAKVSHLSEPPSIVRSATKSYVHTSFLKRAGWLTQLLALEPLGPSFLGFFRG